MGNYVHEVLHTAFTAALEEVAMIEFFVGAATIFLLFVLWLLKINNQPKEVSAQQEKLTLRGLFRKEKYRIGAIAAFLFVFHLCIVSPYAVYLGDQQKIDVLILESNTLSQASVTLSSNLSSALAQYTNAVFAESYFRDEENYFDPTTSDDWAKCGEGAFDIGEYKLACQFFGRSFNYFEHSFRYSSSPNYLLARYNSLYICAVLETNQLPYPAEAIGKFQRSLINMTNIISVMVTEKIPDAFDDSGVLGGSIIPQLKQIEDRVPSETNFVDQIIATVQQLEMKAINQKR
jgi:hypothetical protein